jgi:hypothetical protein
MFVQQRKAPLAAVEENNLRHIAPSIEPARSMPPVAMIFGNKVDYQVCHNREYSTGKLIRMQRLCFENEWLVVDLFGLRK